MTLQELMLQARTDLDDLISPYLWADQDLVDYINYAVYVMAQDCCLIYDDYSPFTIIPVSVALGSHYQKDPRIVRVREARLTDSLGFINEPLEWRTRDWLENHWSNWPNAIPARPRVACENMRTGYIRLLPAPDASYMMNLIVYRLPLAPLTLNDMTASPEIEIKYHKYLKHGILSRAYLKADNEAYDARKAETERILFVGSDDGKIEGDVKKVFNLSQVAIQTTETVGVNKAFC